MRMRRASWHEEGKALSWRLPHRHARSLRITMVALAFTSAFASAALGRARRGARAGAARRAVPVRAGDEVRSDADDDATTTFRDDLDAPTSRRGLPLGAGGLAVATAPGLIPPRRRERLAGVQPRDPRGADRGRGGVEGPSASIVPDSSSVSERKSRYAVGSGSERNTWSATARYR